MKTVRCPLSIDSGWPAACLLAGSLLAGSLLATAAHADPEPAGFDRLIDLSLADASVVEVLQSFASIAGVELKAPETVHGEVTLELDDVPIRLALHQTCRLRALRCELLPGHGDEPGQLWVRSVADDESGVPAGFFETLSLSLAGASGREVLEAFSKIAGRPVHIEPGELAPIHLELRHVPWPLALLEICDLAGCEVSWGSRWRVTPGSPPSGRRRSLDLDGAPLEDVLRSLTGDPIWGSLGPLRLEIPTELAADVRVPVSAKVEAAPWPELLAALCNPAGLVCGVRYGDPGVLEVGPAPGAKEAPRAGIEPTPPSTTGASLGLRWSRGGRLLAAEPVTLDWEHPAAELTDGEGGRLRVVWIPFEPGHQELLPIAYRCDRAELTLLPLLALPPGPASRSAGGSHELRLEAVEELPETASSRRTPDACSSGDGTPLKVALASRSTSELPPPSPELSLEARVGALLLLVSAEGRNPAAALVSLGDDSLGWRRLALLHPGASGDSPSTTRLEQLAIAPRSTLEILLESTDDVLVLTLPAPRARE